MNKLLMIGLVLGMVSLPVLADGNVIHSWETEQGNCGHKACKGDVDIPDIPDVPDVPVTPSTPSVPSSNLFPAQYNHQPIYDKLLEHDTLLDGLDETTSTIMSDIEKNTANIKTNKKNIQKNTQAIKELDSQVAANKSSINNIQNRLDNTDSRINKLDDKIESGLATVTALTSLHPNPRAKGRTQIATGVGMYRDNVAGAIGIFHFINDNTMLSAGASYGGHHEFAGNVGVTFSFGGKK